MGGSFHVVKHVSVIQRPASRGQQTPCSSSLLFPLQRQVSGEAARANSQFTVSQQKKKKKMEKQQKCVSLGACSPFRSSQRSFKKGEEKKAESDVHSSSCSPKPAGKGETGRRPGRLCNTAVVVCLTHLSSAPCRDVSPSSLFCLSLLPAFVSPNVITHLVLPSFMSSLVYPLSL